MHGTDASPELRALVNSDLNLLVALHALLSTSSVTTAAARLGRTQSATSHALARLRVTLGDPLFVRSGRGLTRTPRGEQLLGEVELALRAAAQVFRAPSPFDPRTTDREVVIACPDLLTPMLPTLLAHFGARAPGLRMTFELPRPDLASGLAGGSIDLAIGAAFDAHEPALVRTRIGEVRFAVVGRKGHPALRKRTLSMKAWLDHPHVVVRTGNANPNLIEEALTRAGLTRRVGFTAPSFLAALHVVAATDFFLSGPVDALRGLAPLLGLSLRPLPLDMPPIPVAVFFHQRMQRDPAHQWIREQLIRVIAAGLRGRRP